MYVRACLIAPAWGMLQFSSLGYHIPCVCFTYVLLAAGLLPSTHHSLPAAGVCGGAAGWVSTYVQLAADLHYYLLHAAVEKTRPARTLHHPPVYQPSSYVFNSRWICNTSRDCVCAAPERTRRLLRSFVGRAAGQTRAHPIGAYYPPTT